MANTNLRIGHGYDVHRLVDGRKLILGGVHIPWEKGLLGHSDADVLTHAIMDALLGAAGLGDIGKAFPDTDPALEGISSLILLERTVVLLRQAGYEPVNVIAMADSHTPALLRRISAASSRSSGVVIFRFSSSPSVSCTGMPSASTALQSSVIAISCSFAF